MFNFVHVTHEAVYKVGGIGTVLEGLINSRPYRDHVGETVLVCPLFYPENPQRLGHGGLIEYSSLDHIADSSFNDAFHRVEREWNVRVVFGQRPVEDEATARRTLCKVLLIDLRGINRDRVNELKGRLWEQYGLQSNRYEHVWDFEQYVQLAGPAAAALDALRLGTSEQPAIVLAHEFMGLPTALTLAMQSPRYYRTLFHAHEVATVRRLVEEHPGHDVMFYHALEAARRSGSYLSDVFGSQHDFFKHALVDASPYCDGLLAVGHHVVRELQFLGGRFEAADITLAYNGISASRVSPEVRETSRAHLRAYCESLLGWRPTWVFTHVTRLVRSKAMWRDFDVLLAMDDDLGARRQSAVMLVLSTELPRRPLDDVLRMEREWDWPLAHREGPPDLTQGEAEYYRMVQAFNARARNIRVVFINQFGFGPETCGQRVPPETEFLDLRRGSDVEFGLSLYEPYGISPLEPLGFGGICVVSTTCGCVGFVRQAQGTEPSPNVVMVDYLESGRAMSVKDAMRIGETERRDVEIEVAKVAARQLLARLPESEEQRRALLHSGYELAHRMSWDFVAERYILPAARRATVRRRILNVG